MDENEKIEDIKAQILNKVSTALKYINDTSPCSRDVQNSMVVKNLIEAYTNLTEGDELL